MTRRKYRYVGPESIRSVARRQGQGIPMVSVEDVRLWLAQAVTDRILHDGWIATFTINCNEVLYLAPRRSEHVACAGGEPVLAAGEVVFDRNLEVVEISNQSTGYCPEPESWETVSAVFDRLGLVHPDRFTHEVVFRRCTHCAECNIVKDGWFECEQCGTALPATWNFT